MTTPDALATNVLILEAGENNALHMIFRPPLPVRQTWHALSERYPVHDIQTTHDRRVRSTTFSRGDFHYSEDAIPEEFVRLARQIGAAVGYVVDTSAAKE